MIAKILQRRAASRAGLSRRGLQSEKLADVDQQQSRLVGEVFVWQSHALI